MIIRELITKWGFEIDDGPLKKADAGVKTLTLSIGAMTVALGGATAAMGFFLKKGGDMEQTNIAFETMLGSAEKATKLIGELKDFTKTTPFELEDTLIGAKRLLAYNIEAEKLIPTLTALGNVAAGVGRERLPFLILALGQVKTATKLRGQELRQFTEAGVPLLAALAEQMNIKEADVFTKVSAGEVMFEDVEKALIKMTSGEGKFADLMVKQSKSFLGLLSIIRDTLNIIAIEIGTKILPMGKKYVTMVLKWIKANEKLIKLRMIKFFQKLEIVIRDVFKILHRIISSIMELIKLFGGLEKVAVNLAKVMGIVFGVASLASIGMIISSVFSLIRALKLMGMVGLIANLKTFAIPLLIGAAFLALLAILEDLVFFARHDGSLLGDWLDSFAKPEQIERLRKAMIALVKTSKELAGSVFDAIGRLFGADDEDSEFNKTLDKRAARLNTFINLLEKTTTLMDKVNTFLQPTGDEGDVTRVLTDPQTGEKFKKRLTKKQLAVIEGSKAK